jgi:hypothetical protein
MTELFDTGAKLKLPARPCTAAPVGSGPAGETCGTCEHLVRRVSPSGKRFLKCGLVRQLWTKGPGSDIRAKWPACRCFEPLAAGRNRKRLDTPAPPLAVSRDLLATPIEAARDRLAKIIELATAGE